jgi:hypothetical protein
MAPLALNRAASRVSAPAATPRTGVVRIPRVVVFAQDPRFTLENSRQTVGRLGVGQRCKACAAGKQRPHALAIACRLRALWKKILLGKATCTPQL